RPGRAVRGDLSHRVAGRLAADRPHRCDAVRRGGRPTRAAGARYPGAVHVITVVRAGPLSTVQDLGRPGYAHLGVPRSGALDPPALELANHLVGNSPEAAGLETTLRGCTLRTRDAAVTAITGAPAEVRVNGHAAPMAAPLVLAPGSTVEIGPARTGVRSYVAFAGGVTVAPVLGSRSTDTLSGLGPPPLRAGDLVPLGNRWGEPALLDTVR